MNPRSSNSVGHKEWHTLGDAHFAIQSGPHMGTQRKCDCWATLQALWAQSLSNILH